MALFAVNTGCRDGEICKLRWEWVLKLQSLNTSVFNIPGSIVKKGDEQLVVLNRIAMSVVESLRGKHANHVFCYQSKPVLRMLNGAWLRARNAVGSPQVRVHDFVAHLWTALTRGR